MKEPANKAECFRWVIITYVVLFFLSQTGVPAWWFVLMLVCNIYWTFRYIMEKKHWLGA